MTEEGTSKLSDDERRLVLAAIRVLLQLNNRCKPDQEDIQLLKEYVRGTANATQIRDLASKILRLESKMAVQRYPM